MLQKRLKSFLNLCHICVKRWFGIVVIPKEVGGEERIMRTIFHPANFNEKKNTLRPNFMKPPVEPDEDEPSIISNKLSTTRYDYTGLQFCRDHARNHQKEPRRHYWGFARFVVGQLISPRSVDGNDYYCSVQHKPTDDNPAHANVNLGFRVAVGETVDSQVSEYIKQLAASAEILQDPNPESKDWTGAEIDLPMYGSLKYKGK